MCRRTIVDGGLCESHKHEVRTHFTRQASTHSIVKHAVRISRQQQLPLGSTSMYLSLPEATEESREPTLSGGPLTTLMELYNEL
jgi:hypothetical protein